MHQRKSQNKLSLKTAFWISVRIIIYTGFVTAYFFLVLLLLRSWLKHEFDAHKVIYAMASLALIIGQAVLLDFLSVGLQKIAGVKKT